MALTNLGDDVRSALGSFTPSGSDTISLKITPAQTQLADRGAASQVGNGLAGQTGGSFRAMDSGGGGLAGGMSSPGSFQSSLAAGQRLSQNPQLVTHPLGAQTDAQYEAAVAQLSQSINSQYAGVLRDLGFLDADGNFVPGALEMAAARQRHQLQYQQGLARDQVTQNAARGGTVFSGRRAVLQAQAEQPYVTGLAELESGLSGQLGDRYRQATDLMRQFTVDRDALIAAAADRAAQRIMANPVGNAPVGVSSSTGNPSGYSATISPQTAAQMNADQYTPFPILPGANALLAFK